MGTVLSTERDNSFLLPLKRGKDAKVMHKQGGKKIYRRKTGKMGQGTEKNKNIGKEFLLKMQ